MTSLTMSALEVTFRPMAPGWSIGVGAGVLLLLVLFFLIRHDVLLVSPTSAHAVFRILGSPAARPGPSKGPRHRRIGIAGRWRPSPGASTCSPRKSAPRI